MVVMMFVLGGISGVHRMHLLLIAFKALVFRAFIPCLIKEDW
jgi:hypothetical protein